MTDFWTGKNIVVAGGSGFLGSHLCEALLERGVEPLTPRRNVYDFRFRFAIQKMFEVTGQVDILFNLAANVGGIGFNQQHPYSLFYDNTQINLNLIHQSILWKVKKFIQVGTVCSYPKWTTPPFSELALWDGYPEETNAPYGLAKKMALIQLQAAYKEFGFKSCYVLPTNIYGPRDEFNPGRSHVIPALIRKCIEAKNEESDSIEVWGSGNATRDFLYVTDAVEGLLLAAEKIDQPTPINLGYGSEVRIIALLHFIQEITGFKGSVKWDRTKPDGQPRRVLNVSLARELLGWMAQTSLRDGLKETIEWYQKSIKNGTTYNEKALIEERIIA